MKLKNIALGIGFLAAMFSCSMEDDIASDTKGKVDGVSEDLYAALQFNISTGTDLSTKATTGVTGPAEDSDYNEMENSTEMAVNECFVFVANGDNIIGRRHYESADITRSDAGNKNEYTLNKHILVKVPNEKPALTIFAVGMKSDKDDTFANGLYLSATSLSDLKKSTVGKNSSDKGNSLTDFIKVGEGTIKPYEQDQTNGYQISNKTTDFTCNSGTVKCGLASISLGLRAAAIELMSFKIATVGGTTFANLVTSHTGKNDKGEINSVTKNDNEDITASQVRAIVKDVIISPQVVNTVLYPTDGKQELPENDKVFANYEGGITSFMKAYNDKLEKAQDDAAKKEIENSSHPLNHRFYTYQNANATGRKTKVTVKYEVQGVPGECTFYVKTGGTGDDAAKVLAGNLYQLHVTITNAVSTIKVVTKDWKYNKIEQEMQEVIE